MIPRYPLPVWQAALLCGVGVFAVNIIIARVMAALLNAPPTFTPLTFLPVLSGSLGGVLLATAVFYGMTRLVSKPVPAIYVVTGVVLLASVVLPVRLFRTAPPPHPRFRGITVPIAATMLVLHTMVAAASLLAVSSWHKRAAESGKKN